MILFTANLALLENDCCVYWFGKIQPYSTFGNRLGRFFCEGKTTLTSSTNELTRKFNCFIKPCWLFCRNSVNSLSVHKINPLHITSQWIYQWKGVCLYLLNGVNLTVFPSYCCLETCFDNFKIYLVNRPFVKSWITLYNAEEVSIHYPMGSTWQSLNLLLSTNNFWSFQIRFVKQPFWNLWKALSN